MKNLSKYFLMGTVALSGMTAFTACSSENEPSAEVNPTFNGSTVKTQFALNLPYAATGTRQSADVAQQNNNFRGIQDMRLLPFTGDVTGSSASLITLGFNSDAFQSDGSDASQGRYIYRDVEIPVGTKNFVFYGKATGAYSSVDNKFTNGNLVEEGLDGTTPVALDGVKFRLDAINSGLNLANAATADDSESYKKVLKALQTVTDTKVTSADKTIEWTNVDVPASGEADADYAKLNHANKLWEAFKKLTAGSAASVREALTRLEESVGVDALAPGVTAKCNGEGLLQTLKANIATAKELLDKNEETGNKFPADFNLPDGAVQVELGAGNKWNFKSPSVMVGEASIDYAKIAYPAALYYTVNTPVKANDQASTGLADGMWPTKEDWTKNNATWTGWGSEVVNSTRTIALEKAIQYGVANLKTTVKLKTSNLDDNAKAKGGQVKDQNINADSKLKLTGVLVGGQPEYVGWEFKAPATTSFDYTVYDNKIASNAALTTTASDPNYTLVLDNNKAEQATVVYVVLEFVNNTNVDFYGADGMVPKGGKFYLVGKLDMTSVTDANKNGQTHIFVQDHTTVANFTIKDLKNAYNTIPDLRSTSVSVGLAVNLTWENGIVFDDIEI